MGKYNHLKYLKKTKARVNHQCNHCGEPILAGEEYYKEAFKNKFLQFLNARCFCLKCYEQSEESLITIKSRKLSRNEKSEKLNSFF
jgi:hypothetical protein